MLAILCVGYHIQLSIVLAIFQNPWEYLRCYAIHCITHRPNPALLFPLNVLYKSFPQNVNSVREHCIVAFRAKALSDLCDQNPIISLH